MQVTAVTRGHPRPPTAFSPVLEHEAQFCASLSWWAELREMCHPSRKTAAPLIDSGQFCGNASTSVRWPRAVEHTGERGAFPLWQPMGNSSAVLTTNFVTFHYLQMSSERIVVIAALP